MQTCIEYGNVLLILDVFMLYHFPTSNVFFEGFPYLYFIMLNKLPIFEDKVSVDMSGIQDTELQERAAGWAAIVQMEDSDSRNNGKHQKKQNCYVI